MGYVVCDYMSDTTSLTNSQIRGTNKTLYICARFISLIGNFA